MSFSKRLYDIARAEVRSAAGKVKSAAGDLFGADEGDEDAVDAELAELRAEPGASGDAAPRVSAAGRRSTGARAAGARGTAGRATAGPRVARVTSKGGSAGIGEEPEHIRRYYANLELPIGASSLEVKAAYRRLMRRYHPDLHQEDVEKAKVATELAHQLRVAYEGLLAYLGPRGR